MQARADFVHSSRVFETLLQHLENSSAARSGHESQPQTTSAVSACSSSIPVTSLVTSLPCPTAASNSTGSSLKIS